MSFAAEPRQCLSGDADSPGTVFPESKRTRLAAVNEEINRRL